MGRLPDVAVQLRSRVLLFADLFLLDDKDFAILAGALTVDKWATVAFRMDEQGREKLKRQMADRAWQMLEQTMKYGTPPDAKIDAAVEELLAAAWKLINEGRIKKPEIPLALVIAHDGGAKAPEEKKLEENAPEGKTGEA